MFTIQRELISAHSFHSITQHLEIMMGTNSTAHCSKSFVAFSSFGKGDFGFPRRIFYSASKGFVFQYSKKKNWHVTKRV